MKPSVTFFCVLKDGNGYIDEMELDYLLKDLYQVNKNNQGL